MMTKTFTGKEEATCKEIILQTKGNVCINERIKLWNLIPQDIVEAKIVMASEKDETTFMKNRRICNYLT